MNTTERETDWFDPAPSGANEAYTDLQPAIGQAALRIAGEHVDDFPGLLEFVEDNALLVVSRPADVSMAGLPPTVGYTGRRPQRRSSSALTGAAISPRRLSRSECSRPSSTDLRTRAVMSTESRTRAARAAGTTGNSP